MRIATTYKRQDPNTCVGDAIQVITTYSSFNREIINDLERKLSDEINEMRILDIPDEQWKEVNSEADDRNK